MKATICAHYQLPEGHEEIHRFTFKLEEGGSHAPSEETISLRTARVIVSHLEDGNALIQMLRAVANAHPADYDELIGQVFEDAFVKDGPSERMTDHGLAFNNATKAESARR
ncbi:hypothetical protein [uncultured Caballeronia sp.]|jgi:hypothetical protein|uniref:hypothetical protein n=1 Tax=uncultured Caballeronia sp. TaxID=1827198 RepID=UPI001577210B